MESSEEVLAMPAVVRKEYLERMQAMIAHYRRELGLAGIDYSCSTPRSRSTWR